MTRERMEDLANQLDHKAELIWSGFYGKDDDDESWAADCRRAAKRLRRGAVLSPIDLEELECGTDATREEVTELASFEGEPGEDYLSFEGEAGDNLPEVCNVCHAKQGDDCQCSETIAEGDLRDHLGAE
jgi:hypothetical protein